VHERILDDRPLDETHPIWPTSHCGALKAAGAVVTVLALSYLASIRLISGLGMLVGHVRTASEQMWKRSRESAASSNCASPSGAWGHVRLQTAHDLADADRDVTVSYFCAEHVPGDHKSAVDMIANEFASDPAQVRKQLAKSVAA
jgi:hypothetical protein